MVTITSRSVEDTVQVGERWGQAAFPGWLIGLTGDLGAGKTHLVKGLARGLGVSAVVSSPTFALMHEFAGGRLPLWHMDLYRLSGPDEIFNAGIWDCLEESKGVVVVVEWMDRWLSNSNPSNFARRNRGKLRLASLWITAENERQIRYEDFGD